MGTRGAIGFYIDGKEKVTYNHFDSYPEGLGNNILKQLSGYFNSNTVEDMKKAVAKIRMINEDDIPTSQDVQACKNYTDLNVGEQSTEDWYCLLRNAQGSLIANMEIGIMIDSAGFLLESLFCEWAYIVNLDTNKLEVYEGCNKNPSGKGRYVNYTKDSNGYCGVELISEIPLDELPESMSEGYDEEDNSYVSLNYSDGSSVLIT